MAAIKHFIQVWDECVCIGGGVSLCFQPFLHQLLFQGVPTGLGSVLLLQNIVLLQAGLPLYHCSCSVMLCRLLNPYHLVLVLRFSRGKGYLADLWVVEQSRRAIAMARLL